MIEFSRVHAICITQKQSSFVRSRQLLQTHVQSHTNIDEVACKYTLEKVWQIRMQTIFCAKSWIRKHETLNMDFWTNCYRAVWRWLWDLASCVKHANIYGNTHGGKIANLQEVQAEIYVCMYGFSWICIMYITCLEIHYTQIKSKHQYICLWAYLYNIYIYVCYIHIHVYIYMLYVYIYMYTNPLYI